MCNDPEVVDKNLLRILLVMLCLPLLAMTFVAVTKDRERDWNKYAAKHHCKFLGMTHHRDPRYHDQEMYRCDNGTVVR